MSLRYNIYIMAAVPLAFDTSSSCKSFIPVVSYGKGEGVD